MADIDRNGISARLWKLPGQLLLALINATAILVIVAAILALVAIARIDHFAGNLVATMTGAVLSKIDLPQREVLANLRNMTAEIRALRNAVAEIRTGENPLLLAEIARLRELLTILNSSVDRLRNARSLLTDEAIGQLARTVTDGLIKLRACPSDRGTQLTPSTHASQMHLPRSPPHETKSAAAVNLRFRSWGPDPRAPHFGGAEAW